MIRRPLARVLALLLLAATSLVVLLPSRSAASSYQHRANVAASSVLRQLALLNLGVAECPMPVSPRRGDDAILVVPERSAAERALSIEAQRAAMPCYNPLDAVVR